MLGSQFELAISMLVLTYCIMVSVFAIRGGLFSPFFVFHIYIIVGVSVRRTVLASITPESGSYWETVKPYVAGDFATTSMDILALLIVGLISYLVLSRIKPTAKLNFIKLFSIDPERIGFAFTFIIWAACNLLYIAAIVVLSGGLREAITMMQKRALIFGSEVFFVKLLMVGTSMASTLLFFKTVRLKYPVNSVQFAVTAAVCFFTCFIMFLSGSRGMTLSQVLLYFFVWSGGRVTLKASFGILLFVPLSIFLVVFGMALRNTNQRDMQFSVAMKESFESAGETYSHAFPLIDLFAATRYFAHETGFDRGRQFANYPLRFIPRSIYPNKPQILGLQIREFYSGNTLSGAPPTFFGEWYVSFGHLGMIFGGVALGFILHFMNLIYKRSLEEPQYLILYVVILNFCIFSMFRAGMEIALFQLGYALVALMILSRVTRIRLVGGI